MTSQEENLLQMCSGLKKSTDPYQDILSTLPMFNTKKEELSTAMHEIMLRTVDQKNNRTGITAVKNDIKNKLIQLTIETNGKLTPYSIFTNDIQLKKAVPAVPVESKNCRKYRCAIMHN